MAGNGGGPFEDEESLTKIQPLSVNSTPTLNERTINAKKEQTSFTLGERLGLDDIFSLDVWRASIGELLGTAILVFAIDTIVISSIETDTKIPNLLLSILIGLIVTILLLAVHPVSGGHMNPIISFSAALVGLISMSRAVVYILAQCVGSVLGALALKTVVDKNVEDVFSLGGCTLTVIAPGPNGPVAIGIETNQAFWLEVICSFIFLFASIWMAYDYRQRKELGHVLIFTIIGVVLALLVFISTTLTAKKGYAGAGINPARCLGPALIRGGHLWSGHWIFWAGPGIACVAFYIYTKIIPSQHIHVVGYKHDFFNVLKAIAGSS